MRFGNASQVIFTGWSGSRLPSSGSSMNARTRTLSEVGHFRKQVADLDVIASLHRQRVERAVGWSRNASGANFFFQRRHFALRLLDLQGARLASSFTPRSNSCFAAVSRVTSDCALVSSRSLAASSSLVAACCAISRTQRVVIALQAVALRDRGGQRARSLRRLIRSSAAFRHLQIVLRAQQFRARLGKLRRGIFHVQFQQKSGPS